MVKFLVVATGYNCSNYVGRCVDSVRNQTYKHFNAVFVSDGSTDTTHEEILTACGSTPNLIPVKFILNKGAAKRRYDIIHYSDISEELDDETVILLLGLDDELLPDALEIINKEYEKGVYMTYGNWVNRRGKVFPTKSLYFEDETHETRDYRKVPYRSTAPNTFKKFLFKSIPEEDFKINGKWIDTTTESEVMFSCLEMSGKDRIGVIEQPIYVYNENLPNNTLNRLGRKYKYELLEIITKRPKRNLWYKK